jgi:hypothetical protein
MAHVTRAAAWVTKHTAPTVTAALNTGIDSAQANGATAATSTASAVLVLRSAVSPLVSREIARVHRPLLVSRCRGRLVLHPMVAVEAQTSTLATWCMGAVATRMANVESCRWTAVQDGKSPLSSS